jgi:hypothetical protein
MGSSVEKIAMGFITLAVVVAFVATKSNGGAVVKDVFGGASQLFGTILGPVGGTAPSSTLGG